MSQLRLTDIIDPRGRADRKGLIMTAAVLIGAQAGLAIASYLTNFTLGGGAALAIEGILLWLGMVAVSKRMHDLNCGLSCLGWGLLATMILSTSTAFGAMLLFGEDVLLAGAPGYLAVAASVVAPAIALTIWLHCAKGETVNNRYGPPPDESGFSMPDRRSQDALLRRSAAV